MIVSRNYVFYLTTRPKPRVESVDLSSSLPRIFLGATQANRGQFQVCTIHGPQGDQQTFTLRQRQLLALNEVQVAQKLGVGADG